MQLSGVIPSHNFANKITRELKIIN